jgi:limonene-1,2-epoxide hydrolase
MGERENGEAVERFWRALEKEDFEAAKAELHPDFVESYPQSGERIRGIQNWESLVTTYPGFPAITVSRIIGRDDLWVTEAAFDYSKDGSPPYQVCEVQECRDGKIAAVNAVFGAPFEPADWRAAFVERD